MPEHNPYKMETILEGLSEDFARIAARNDLGYQKRHCGV
jgi:hypothetical protein